MKIDKMDLISVGLITCNENHKTLYEQAQEFIGRNVLNLILENCEENSNQYTKTAVEIGRLCVREKATLVVSDNVIAAKLAKAKGFYIDKVDINPKLARAYIGKDSKIGKRISSLNEFEKYKSYKLSFIVVEVHDNTRKEDIELLKEVCKIKEMDVYARGLTEEEILPIKGIDGIIL